MNALFGGPLTGAMRFIIAFIVVMALIAVCAWVVRRFGSGRFAVAASRSRQPRLALIDTAAVDARRRLILVRRDDVEHLVMIGGPTDLVIEQNIARAAPAPARDLAAARSAGIPEAISLEDGTVWPLQPQAEPVPPTRAEPPLHAPARHEPVLPESAPPIGLSADTATKAPPVPQADAPPAQSDAVVQPGAEPLITADPAARPAPPLAIANDDGRVGDMALRLHSGPDRPGTEPRQDIPVGEPRAPSAEPGGEPKSTLPAQAVLSDVRPGKNRQFYESLEQEMASLLGRPTGKM